eukprot:6312623-Amphidinium_carterae.1
MAGAEGCWVHQSLVSNTGPHDTCQESPRSEPRWAGVPCDSQKVLDNTCTSPLGYKLLLLR